MKNTHTEGQLAPALPADEWKRLEVDREVRLSASAGARIDFDGNLDIWRNGTISIASQALPGLIATANAALRDTDPRKITRARVDRLRQKALAGVTPRDDWLNELADALESYLPPAELDLTIR